MGEVVSLSAYKIEKGIAPSRSPYYTLNATPQQISEAARRASEYLKRPISKAVGLPYAVVFGYEDRKGRTKLPIRYSFFLPTVI